MTAAEFSMLVEQRKIAIETTLQSKAMEYSTEADRLHNFKRSAAFTGTSAAQMCFYFAMKHLTSVADMVDHMIKKPPTPAMVDEKIGDAINYLILLEALIKDDATLAF